MKKAYILSGYTGEHADNIEWVVRIFLDERKAQAYCEKLNEICHKYASELDSNRYKDYEKIKEVTKKVQNELKELDPQALVDYTGSSYSVSIADLEE